MKKNGFNKKFFLVLCVLLVTGLFTSCIDYVQTITLDGDYVDEYYKISVPSILMSQSGMDSDDFFEALEEFEYILPPSSRISHIDNGEDIGIEFSISLDLYTDDADEADMLPYFNDDETEIYIPFLLGYMPEVFEEMLYAEGDEEMQALVLTYMAGAKSRLMISKNFTEYMSGAYFECADGDVWNLACYDYGECFCVEIPISTIAMGSSYGIDLTNLIIY